MVELAQERDFILVSDECYIDIYDIIRGKKPTSFTTGRARATEPEDPDDDDDDDDFKRGNIDYDKMFMDQLLDGVYHA